MPDHLDHPPREAAAQPCPIGGAHPVVDLFGPDLAAAIWMPSDLETFGALVSAAVDVDGGEFGCLPCQARHLDTVAADPLTTGFLVEVAGQMVAAAGEVLRMIPGAALGMPAIPPAIDDLWRLGNGEGGDRTPMYDHLATLDDAERRELCADALDLLVGQINLAQSYK